MRKVVVAALMVAVVAGAGWAETAATQPKRVHVEDMVIPSKSQPEDLYGAEAFKEVKKGEDGTVDLPVRRVVLFTSGTGFFEHEGAVEGKATAQLAFTTLQINDVLKSLVAQDVDGGTVGGVRYASQKPLAKALQSFQVDLSGDPGMANLLTQIRGAEVTVVTVDGQYGGKVLGVERREIDGGKGATKPVLNLLTDGGVKPVDLNSVTEVKIRDEKLRKEVAGALQVVELRRDRDKKPVSVMFDGTGKRRVRLGYVVEAPVWKTSYRLMLPAADSKASGKLQGWAIIENGTESDWTDVSLTLVGGRPMSFIENLYASYYVPRPVVQPKSFAGLSPAEHEDGVDVRKLQKEFEKFSNQNTSMNGANVSSSSLFADTTPTTKSAEEAGTNAANDEFLPGVFSGGGINNVPMIGVQAPNYVQGVAALAKVQQVGDSFEFKVEKVNLPRQQSAMFPIMTEAMKVERVSVYNNAVLEENALHGVMLTNTSKSYVRSGPVTIMETGANGATYAGDSLVSDMPPAQHRLLSYGVDQELRVLRETEEKDKRVKVSIKQGVLVVESRHVRTTKYTMDNRGEKEKAVIVEQQRMDSKALGEGLGEGWKITSPEVDEKTEVFCRFRVTAPAGKPTVFKVVEESSEKEETTLEPQVVSRDLLNALESEDMPPAVKKALREYVEAAKGLTDLESKTEELKKERAEVTVDQARVRENLKATEKGTEYYSGQLKKLQDMDERIEGIDAEMAKDRKAKEDLAKKAAGINAE